MPTAIFETQLPYPPDEVFSWHETPGAFRCLMPPHAIVVSAPASLRVGEQAVLRLPMLDVPPLHRLSALTTLFVAEHTRYEPPRLFEDTMRTGPFARWRHVHEFLPIAGPVGIGTLLRDEIHYELPLAPLSAPAGPIIALILRRHFQRRHRITEACLKVYVSTHAGSRPAPTLRAV